MRCTPDEESSGAEKRSYLRYTCRLSAELRLANGDTYGVMLVELGANGVRIHASGHSLVPGMKVCIAVELLREGRPASVLFRSRIAWTQRSHAGLQFIQDSVSSRSSSRSSSSMTRREPEASVLPPTRLDPQPTNPWSQAL